VLHGNYGSIEAEYPNEDLLECSLRRALNLTMAWWIPRLSIEEWDREYKHIFYESKAERELRKEVEARWGDPDEHGRGEFKVERPDVQPAANLNITPARS
jgi:hypothetical protein